MAPSISRLAWCALLLVGCVPATTPILGAGPVRSGDPRLFDDAIAAARLAGYRPVAVSPDEGRFAVIAEADPRGETRFVVQCFREGWVSIHPEGEGVERRGERYVTSRAIRDEHRALAEEIDRVIEVRP